MTEDQRDLSQELTLSRDPREVKVIKLRSGGRAFPKQRTSNREIWGQKMLDSPAGRAEQRWRRGQHTWAAGFCWATEQSRETRCHLRGKEAKGGLGLFCLVCGNGLVSSSCMLSLNIFNFPNVKPPAM